MDNPVAWLVTYAGLTNVVYTQPTEVVDTHYQPLYAPPPQRKWVGLTWDDTPQYMSEEFIQGARWAEATLKEKNGG